VTFSCWTRYSELFTPISLAHLLRQAQLEALVPSSTDTRSKLTSEAAETQRHARALRVSLETLNSLHGERAELVRKAERLAEGDDISRRISTIASQFDQLAEISPAMFENVFDEELAKYDKFLLDMDKSERKQNELLVGIQSQNSLFLRSRREDPSIKEREHALQSLDLSYQKYREIVRNLEEGFKFYNDFAGILTQFKESCKMWRSQRSQEIRTLSRSLQSMSLQDDTELQGKKASATRRAPSSIPPHVQPVPKTRLPDLNSSEWGFEPLQLPPGPANRKHA